LVDAVAAFVQDAEERFVEVLRIVAGGDAAVAGAGAGAKWVRGDVKSAGFEVEADRLRCLAAEFLLLRDGELSVQDFAFWFFRRGEQLGDERDQFLTQRGEEVGD